MAIKVIVHYPETEEGMKEFNDRQAQITLDILSRMLTPKQLDTLMKNLESQRKAE